MVSSLLQYRETENNSHFSLIHNRIERACELGNFPKPIITAQMNSIRLLPVDFNSVYSVKTGTK